MRSAGLRTLSALTANFAGAERELAALGISPEDDLWPKFAFKVATGAGKTKCMSLAIVWSYFHKLRESDSPMARHLVVVAPGITVFERLREDFGNGRISTPIRLSPLNGEATGICRSCCRTRPAAPQPVGRSI